MIAFSRGSVQAQNKPAQSKTKTGPDSLTFHPACLAFPELPEDELQALANDIKKHGLLNDITLLNKQILEGRSRYKACKIAGVKPRFEEWEGTGSPTEWVISQNLIRRHLTSSQRAVVALELLPLLEAEAKDRQRLSCGRGKKGVKKDTVSFGNGRAAEAAAKLTHSNFSYVAAAKAVKEQAPELLDDIRAGRLTIPDAKTLAKLPNAKRKNVRARLNGHPQNLKRLIREVELSAIKGQTFDKKACSTKGEIQILCGDCLKVMPAQIADRSVSVVVTSPPYNRGVQYNSYKDDLPFEKYLKWLEKGFHSGQAGNAGRRQLLLECRGFPQGAVARNEDSGSSCQVPRSAK